MAMNRTSRPFPEIVKKGALAAAGLMLAGCVNFSALDDLQTATPPAGAFEQALFKDYAFLAGTFGDVGQASYTAFDQEGSIPLAKTDAGVAELANEYAAKAILLSNGSQVDPETSKDIVSHNLRDRLVRALTPGHDTFPRDAARAQADYDCWMLNAKVPSQAQATAQCRRSLDASLSRLESEVHAVAETPATSTAASPAPDASPAPAASPAPEPTPAEPPATQSSAQPPGYAVTFAFNSTVLTAQAMDVLRRAIADARAGGQPKIELVGHTDTSGTAEYNMQLSVKRAEVVRDALVNMGARREAITASGVGESDLAVPTADGVRDSRNRRAVVTLSI